MLRGSVDNKVTDLSAIFLKKVTYYVHMDQKFFLSNISKMSKFAVDAVNFLIHWWPYAVAGSVLLVVLVYLVKTLTTWLQRKVDRHRYELMYQGEHILEDRGWTTAGLRVAFSACMIIVDLGLDYYVGVTYLRRGLYVFGLATLAIPAVAGLAAYICRRLAWKVASLDHKINDVKTYYFNEQRDEAGYPKPGWTEAMLSILQVEPILISRQAFKNPDNVACQSAWDAERSLHGILESFPQFFLQIYALLCAESIESDGNLFSTCAQLASTASSLNSLVNAGFILKYRILPGREVEPLPSGFGERMVRLTLALDYMARMSVLCCLCVAFRRQNAKIHSNSNLMPLIITFVEVVVSILTTVCALNTTLLDFATSEFWLAVTSSFLGIPALTLPRHTFRQMQTWQAMTHAWRSLEWIAFVPIAWLRFHLTLGSNQYWFTWLAVCGVVAFPAVSVLHWYGYLQRNFCGEPLFPTSMHDESNWTPAHWGAILNNARILRDAETKAPKALSTADNDGWMPSHLAAKNGHESALRFLHKVAPATLSTAANDGRMPSHLAAENGYESALRFLHEVAPATLSTAANDGCMPSHCAAQNGHESALRFLHKLVPATLSTADNDGWMPSHVAAEYGHESALRFLHEVAPATLSTTDNDGWMPSHYAAQNGYESALRFLHEVAPATLSTAANGGWMPSHIAAQYGHESALRFLHEVAPATLSTAANDGRMPSHIAARNGYESALRFVHKVAPATLSTAANDGWMPSHFAAENGHESTLRFLHEVTPATLSTADNGGWMPSHYAAQNGNESALRCLHEVAPATLSTADNDGRMPSHIAARYGHESALRFLHKVVPATLSTADNYGWMPSHFAAQYGFESALRFLHEVAPATLSTADNDGCMPSHLVAAQNGHESALRFLHEVAPATLSTADNDGHMPSHYAAQYGYESALRFLHEVAPATLSTAMHDGWMPSHLAAQNGHESALRFLQEVAPATSKTASQGWLDAKPLGGNEWP